MILKRKREVERLSEQKNPTPEMKIKPQVHHHHKPEVSKVQLRLNNWNANPGKKMKVDRSIDSVNDCEQWRKLYQFMNNSS